LSLSSGLSVFPTYRLTFVAMPDLKNLDEVLQQYFDKVLVLTVPRFKERQEKVKQRLSGISFDFFYGVDKNDLSEESISSNYHYDKKNSLAVRQYYPPLNSGEIACALSHRNIYQAMIDNNWQHVLVFEDDVVPDENNISMLPEIVKELPADWELFYLGYLKNEKISFGAQLKNTWYKIMALFGASNMSVRMLKNRLPKNFSPHLFKAGFHDCTHAYAISLSAAKKLVKDQTPVIQRADNLLSALVLKEELNAFASKVFLFNQEVFTNLSDQSHIREKWGKV
jgi:glycosyl transferase, family 25